MSIQYNVIIIKIILSDMSFVPLQQPNLMASNNQNAHTSTTTLAPIYVFITGANPDVKLPSFQFRGFDPMSLQFGGIKALPAPATNGVTVTEESFPPLVSTTTATATTRLPSKGKRSAVVIPNPTWTISRKYHN